MVGIATASEQQASGIGEVNRGLSAVNEVTGQNRQVAEQSTSAAGQLRAQVRTLEHVVHQFRLSPVQEAAKWT